jgi:hypothetical protein
MKALNAIQAHYEGARLTSTARRKGLIAIDVPRPGTEIETVWVDSNRREPPPSRRVTHLRYSLA